MTTERVDIVFSSKGDKTVVRTVEEINRSAKSADSSIEDLKGSLDELGQFRSPKSELTRMRSSLDAVRSSTSALGRASKATSKEASLLRSRFNKAFSREFAKEASGAESSLKGVQAESKKTIALGSRIRSAFQRIRSSRIKAASKDLKAVNDAGKKTVNVLTSIKNLFLIQRAAGLLTNLVRLVDVFTNVQNRLRVVTDSTAKLDEVTRRLFDIANRSRAEFKATSELYARLAISARELGKSEEDLLRFTESLNQAIVLSGASAKEAEAGIIQLSQGIASGRLQGDELRSVLEQLPVVADVIAKELKVTRGQLRGLGSDGKITAGLILKAFESSRKELGDKFAKTVPTLAQSFVVLRNKVLQYIGEIDKSTGILGTASSVILTAANNVDILARGLKILTAVIVNLLIRKGIVSAITAIRALSVAIALNPIGAILTLLVLATSVLIAFSDQIMLSSDGIATLSDFLVSFLKQIIKFIVKLAEGFKLLFEDLLGFLSSVFENVDLSFKDLIIFIGFFADSFIGIFRFMFESVVIIFSNLPEALAEIFIASLNFIVSSIRDSVSVISQILSALPGFSGIAALARVTKIGKIENPFAGTTSVADTLVDEFNRLFEPGPVVKAIEAAFKDAESRAADRLRRQRRPAVDLTQATRAAPTPIDDGSLKRLRDELTRLENSLFPILAAQREFADAVRITEQAVARLNLSEERAAVILEKKREALEDQLNPLAATVRELDKEISLLRLSEKERERVTRIQDLELTLRKQGIELSILEKKDLEEKVALIQKLNEKPIKIKSPIQDLLKDLQTTAILMENAFVSSFNNIENAIVDFVKTGEFNFGKFIDNILVDLTKLATRQALLQLVTAVGIGAPIPGATALPAFQTGGSFNVGGSGPPDSKIIAFKASPGERVDISTRKQQRGTGGGETIINMTTNIITPNPRSFKATQAQTMNRFTIAARAATRRRR